MTISFGDFVVVAVAVIALSGLVSLGWIIQYEIRRKLVFFNRRNRQLDRFERMRVEGWR